MLFEGQLRVIKLGREIIDGTGTRCRIIGTLRKSHLVSVYFRSHLLAFLWKLLTRSADV